MRAAVLKVAASAATYSEDVVVIGHFCASLKSDSDGGLRIKCAKTKLEGQVTILSAMSAVLWSTRDTLFSVRQSYMYLWHLPGTNN